MPPAPVAACTASVPALNRTMSPPLTVMVVGNCVAVSISGPQYSRLPPLAALHTSKNPSVPQEAAAIGHSTVATLAAMLAGVSISANCAGMRV